MKSLHTGELTTALETFFGAVRKSLDKKAEGDVSVKSPFDGYDIIILDNNLTHLKIEGAAYSGGGGWVYSRVYDDPYVVSLKKTI